jgi:hypothetical protein
MQSDQGKTQKPSVLGHIDPSASSFALGPLIALPKTFGPFRVQPSFDGGDRGAYVSCNGRYSFVSASAANKVLKVRLDLLSEADRAVTVRRLIMQVHTKLDLGELADAPKVV